METIEDFLDIKLADGKALPYLSIVLLYLVISDVGETITFATPVVIVSDTDFNKIYQHYQNKCNGSLPTSSERKV